jgi:formate dehydrogenase subunit delta
MDTDSLARMANRIADFFEAMPDREQAIEDIATHIRKFWEPRMRRALLELFDGGGAGLSELALAAIARHRALVAGPIESPSAPPAR